MRALPEFLVDTWEELATESALSALATSRKLHRATAQWQAVLVRDALAEGASWEDIGEALATTRQAAWARFRSIVGTEEGAKGMESGEDLQRRAAELRDTGQKRLRDLDEKWRDEQARLWEQVQEGKNLLNQAKQRHARERQAAREEYRRSIAALKVPRS